MGRVGWVGPVWVGRETVTVVPGSNSADGFALEAAGGLSSEERKRLLGLAVGLLSAAERVGGHEREEGVAGTADDERNDGMSNLLCLR